ncbi:hypothetical protein SAMN05421630_115130 [Prauserella marina]|uniref:Uncharacterized protein n=1 Tax=Prauserella marina TaxID=530584 RepID=A0A1G6Z7F2_9PSEU|nr:hypothetical protein [Prauserella marina]PWV71433.1 hypothetical protein DES30_112149 [Prauserella marina]SDD97746.1 hypothetical protein SAMN05421630_115130 [Prauserella marina]
MTAPDFLAAADRIPHGEPILDRARERARLADQLRAAAEQLTQVHA